MKMLEVPHVEIRKTDMRECEDEDIRSTGISPLVKMLRDILQGREQESFVMVILDYRGRPAGWREVARGHSGHVSVDCRAMFRTALACDAHALIVAHNHPSGDPTPSTPDMMLTAAFKQAGDLVNVPIIDHIIIGSGDRYYSFTQGGQQSLSPMDMNAKRQPPELDD